MNESAKSLTLMSTPIGDKNKAKTKGLGQYITTGQMLDTTRLAKEFNMTTRVILLLNLLQMKRYTSTTSVKVQRSLKLGARAGPREVVYGGGALEATGLKRAAQAVSGGRV